MGAREPARRVPAARALSPTPPLRRCGLYKTCEPKKCGKKWRQRLKPAVYEIERPAGAPCTLENLENIKNLKRDQLPIDCKGKELKTDKKVVLPDMSGDKVDFSSCAPPRPAPAPRHALSGAPNARASPRPTRGASPRAVRSSRRRRASRSRRRSKGSSSRRRSSRRPMLATCAAPLASPPLRPPPPISSWLCAQLEFGKSRQPTEENSYNDDIITPADLTKADFQKASLAMKGDYAGVRSGTPPHSSATAPLSTPPSRCARR